MARVCIQAVVLILIVSFLAWVASNVVTNIARLNINTGFSFLARPAGFEISQKLIDFGDAASYFDVFIVALLNTVVLTAIAILFATLLGFVIGLARLSCNQLVAGVRPATSKSCATFRCCCSCSTGTSRCCARCRARARA